jgi:imidazole glycerol phosphate synthase glutamine amidotransferase subunit
MTTIAAILDYGAGNLVSVAAGLGAIGADVRIARRPVDLVGVGLVVVPGVGASGPAMARLRRSGLDRALRDTLADGAWYLGICLGLQLLFERSDEDGAERWASWRGCPRHPAAPRLPHIGWNTIQVLGHTCSSRASALDGLLRHSYAGVPRDRGRIVAETEQQPPSVIADGRLLGTQFHPERSGTAGLRILAEAVALAARA